ncbi:MAG TPA: TIGR03067 domain-containing protein [Tepidisphaeraceae bacterium]|nr:TIGR03067 domain-containing protein [Tepidisphaeraceae bacterium]
MRRLNPEPAFVAALLLYAAGAFLAARPAPAAAADTPAEDLLAVQGKWEREEPPGSDAPYRRVVKEVKGNEEVVTYYRADGSVWRSHRAQFKLSRSGDVKVFTFSNVQITEGDGKGSKYQGASSYIYLATDRQFKEVSGFLPGQEAQGVLTLLWTRAKDDLDPAATLPMPDKRLQGEWEPFHSEEGGVDQLDYRDYLVKLDGHRFLILREGQLMLKGTFTTYSAREPRRIDLNIEEDVDNPKNAGKKMLGIYAIEGDQLKWCTGTTVASQPPTEFATHEGEPYMLVIMRRLKAKKKD